jgi:hypothetical protein
VGRDQLRMGLDFNREVRVKDARSRDPAVYHLHATKSSVTLVVCIRHLVGVIIGSGTDTQFQFS